LIGRRAQDRSASGNRPAYGRIHIVNINVDHYRRAAVRFWRTAQSPPRHERLCASSKQFATAYKSTDELPTSQAVGAGAGENLRYVALGGRIPTFIDLVSTSLGERYQLRAEQVGQTNLPGCKPPVKPAILALVVRVISLKGCGN
jgi:hypothetical protein